MKFIRRTTFLFQWNYFIYFVLVNTTIDWESLKTSVSVGNISMISMKPKTLNNSLYLSTLQKFYETPDITYDDLPNNIISNPKNRRGVNSLTDPQWIEFESGPRSDCGTRRWERLWQEYGDSTTSEVLRSAVW